MRRDALQWCTTAAAPTKAASTDSESPGERFSRTDTGLTIVFTSSARRRVTLLDIWEIRFLKVHARVIQSTEMVRLTLVTNIARRKGLNPQYPLEVAPGPVDVSVTAVIEPAVPGQPEPPDDMNRPPQTLMRLDADPRVTLPPVVGLKPRVIQESTIVIPSVGCMGGYA